MSNAAHRSPPTAQSHVDVQVSPVIAADFEKRQVFPELLRPAEAFDRINYSHVYRVTVDYAEKVLEDAQERRQDRTLPKGMPRAFTVLIERLHDDIQRAKGLWRDPGLPEVMRRHDLELACFAPGEKARLWLSADNDQNGDVVTITEGYGMRGVLDENEGEYIKSDGRRLQYRPGYTYRRADGRTFFGPAGELQTMDYKPGHLRLVWSRP